MAVLRPPFDLAEVTLFSAPDRLIRFPDRYIDTPPPATPSRYEGSQMWLIQVTPAQGHTGFSIRWPADSCTKAVDLLPADAAALGIPKLLELSLLPFALADVLRVMAGGIPTFYFGYSGVAYPDDDSAARASDSPITAASATFGIHFQDRVALAPWAWFDRIANALRPTRPSDAAVWDTWSALYTGRRSLRILDAQGRPFAGQSITIAITDTGGNPVSSTTKTSDAGGDLISIPLPGAGQKGIVSWQPNPPLSEQTLPVFALIESPTDAIAGQSSFPLSEGFTGGHLQLLALSQWFAPNVHDDPMSSALGARYRLRNHMQPIVDGIPAFTRLLEDLALAKGQDGAAYFAGWAFTDFPLQPGADSTSLFNLSKDILAAGGQVEILVAQFLQASDQALGSMSAELGLAFLILSEIGTSAALITAGSTYTNPVGLSVWAALAAGLIVLYIEKLSSGDQVAKALRSVVEQTDPDFLTKLQTIQSPRFAATLSPHPVTFADNPLSQPIPLPDGRTLADLQNKFGVFHQKIQLIKHAGETGPNAFVAYVGGIDINENRLDSPGHQGAAYRKPDSTAPPVAAPFHDVHSRITGAAAGEVFEVFSQRSQLVGNGATLTPSADDWGTPGRDIMQVAQTSFKPKTGSGTSGFPWAPQGNATTHDTLVRAIRAAREYIYIEEQYMVPDDEYIQALIDAADHCQRLIILLPTFLEIFFGDIRRGQMFDRLAGTPGQLKWGDRMLIGTPMRRPVLSATGRITSLGRCTLLADIGPADSTIFLGPPARVPGGRFFFWIGGELMYAMGSTTVTGPGGQPAKQLDVLRGGLGSSQRWCPNPRAHVAGEPATLSQPTGIFLHSKIMMVDDLFVSIGSTNVNRRGFFHDGEIHAFAIPQDLKQAADNPARDLRTRLWAEQLGLAPDMGAALLADPIAAFELFRRSRYQGNRFSPLSELKVPVPTLNDLPEAFEVLPTWARDYLQFGIQTGLEVLSDDIFNTLSDPTTGIEPHPVPGPGLP